MLRSVLIHQSADGHRRTCIGYQRLWWLVLSSSIEATRQFVPSPILCNSCPQKGSAALQRLQLSRHWKAALNSLFLSLAGADGCLRSVSTGQFRDPYRSDYSGDQEAQHYQQQQQQPSWTADSSEVCSDGVYQLHTILLTASFDLQAPVALHPVLEVPDTQAVFV